MKTLRLFQLLFALAALSTWSTPRLDAQTYDARKDFSLAGNPNGVWSYGTIYFYADGFAPSIHQLTDLDFTGQQAWYTDAGDEALYMPGAGPHPIVSIQANTTGGTVTYSSVSGTATLPPDQLNLDSIGYPVIVVRWTAPADGVYDVTGFFQRNDTVSDGAVSVSVYQHSTVLLYQQDALTGVGARANFNLSALPLAAGTTLDFETTSTAQSHVATGLSATIGTVGPVTVPVVDAYATAAYASVSQDIPAVVTLTRAGDASQKLVVHYALQGSARAGVNYTALSGKVKFKPGKSTAVVKVKPLGSTTAAKTTLRLVLKPGEGYHLGNATDAKVKIVGLHLSAPGAVDRTPLR